MRANATSIAVLTGTLLLASLFPQVVFSQAIGRDLPVGPAAISGLPSSARHCVSGNSSNVHAIGWVDTNSRLSITFDAEGTLTTAVARLDLDGERAAVGYGDPDLRLTASFAGTLVLYVSGRGQASCYRYKVEIEPPSALTTGHHAETQLRVQRRADVVAAKTAKDLSGIRAISGLASSAKNCVAGNYVAAVYPIGRVEQRAQVRVTFESDFDPIAGLTSVNPDGQTGSYLINDDSGGDLEPLLSVTMAEAGTLALFVAGVNGGTGCFSFKVEITPPSSSPSPTPSPGGGVSLTGIVSASGTSTRISGATVRILDGPSSGRSATTNSNGEYRLENLTSANANVAASSSGYTEARNGVFINGTNTLNFSLQRAELWSRNGEGNTVFDKPSYVTRVRITGRYTGTGSNFVVWCGRSLLVNEIIGTRYSSTTYDGVHSAAGCTEVRVEISTGVSWTFTEVR